MMRQTLGSFGSRVCALPAALSVFSVLLAAVSPLEAASFSVLTVAAAAAGLLACAVLSVLAAPPVPPTRVRTALRDRARRTAFLPQRDPDARGRRRPRAPGRSVLLSTAVA
ncbi:MULTISPECIES: DUF6412 domain-containing protein [unclassified Streptomyces]|uniref:DUF6412 domain-containing protein n=2 Tax=Streptomyces TaxID=1883 RepID=UPI000A6972BD|nr:MULTISPECIES: DUF6412 domain-containing protein [unclassified Streptomyces]